MPPALTLVCRAILHLQLSYNIQRTPSLKSRSALAALYAARLREVGRASWREVGCDGASRSGCEHCDETEIEQHSHGTGVQNRTSQFDQFPAFGHVTGQTDGGGDDGNRPHKFIKADEGDTCHTMCNRNVQHDRYNMRDTRYVIASHDCLEHPTPQPIAQKSHVAVA
jgi:hypothetical protein